LRLHFKSASQELEAALRLVWEARPTSLRVKELLETVETFGLVEAQIAAVQARAGAARRIEHIYDLACGHGLLGVLLAYRFSSCSVVCVDLERRDSFDHLVEGFRASVAPDPATGEAVALANLRFMQADMRGLALPPHSFAVCVHACNEANTTALELCTKHDAAYAAMPCCIRGGILSLAMRRLPDDARHAALVGAMAHACGAHTLTAIDRRITNRHLLIFGGYEANAAGAEAAACAARATKAVERHAARSLNWHGRARTASPRPQHTAPQHTTPQHTTPHEAICLACS
jgi:SAM-dependent methyltransferase